MNRQDLEFTEALRSPTALDARLASLERTRDLMGGVHFILNAFLAVAIAAAIWGICKGVKPGPMSSILPMVILGNLVCHIRRSAAQSEIRTMLAFRKLRDQTRSAN